MHVLSARYQAAMLIMAAAAFSISSNSAMAGETLERISRSGKIVLATRDASIPFSYKDNNGKPLGYTVDICLKLVDAIKLQLKRPDLRIDYMQVTPSSRFKAITEGLADLECGPTTNTAERRALVGFTIANFIASAKMLVKKDSGIRNWADLRNKTIVTTAATTNAKSIADRNDVGALRITLLEAKDDLESFHQVETGKADAFAMDDVLLYGLKAMSRHPADYQVVASPLTVEPYAIMFSKNDIELKKLMDAEMARIIYNGDVEKLYKKWFNNPIPPSGVNLDMPMNALLRNSFQFPSDKVAD
ncbi:amino acid ABC transporter substrate-binding protein [Undibacterium sp. Ji83W]|uniref:amino acid ABC transporter substrate-binding protein n=1 Tax=Undibacterium sp. Ji83W TaxID=3413043 RepID=UPI003BF00A47